MKVSILQRIAAFAGEVLEEIYDDTQWVPGADPGLCQVQIGHPTVNAACLVQSNQSEPKSNGVKDKGKVKCTLVQALRLCTGRTAHRGSGGIARPFHDHGTRRG